MAKRANAGAWEVVDGKCIGPRTVIDLVTGETYPSAKAAAKAMGRSEDFVRKRMRDRVLADGRALCYALDPDRPRDASEFGERRSPGRAVVDLATGSRYPTVACAARKLGLPTGDVREALSGGPAIDGHDLRYEDDGDAAEPAPHGPRQVVDLATGETFRSATAAGSACGKSWHVVRRAIEKRLLVDGRAFCYADDDRWGLDDYTEEPPRFRQVVDLATGEVHASVAHAARAVGRDVKTVRYAIGSRMLANGRPLWWADDPNPPDVAEFREPHGGGGKARPVVDLATGEEYPTMTAAAEAAACSLTRVYRGILGRVLVGGRPLWWADDPNPPDISEFGEPGSGSGQARSVVDLATGEEYPSISEAGRRLGIGGQTISNGMEARRLVGGRPLWWADDPNPPDVGDFTAPAPPHRAAKAPVKEDAGREGTKVADAATGEVYISIAAASLALGCSPSKAKYAVNHRKLIGGHALYRADGEAPDISEFSEFGKRPADRPVFDLATGESYDTMSAAADALGVTNRTIFLGIAEKRLLDGHAFCDMADRGRRTLGEYRSTGKLRRHRPVEDVTAGIVFPSRQAAAKALGVDYSVVNRVIEKGVPLDGHMYRYVEGEAARADRSYSYRG